MNFPSSLDPKAMTIEGIPSASKGKSVTPALEHMTDCVLQGEPRQYFQYCVLLQNLATSLPGGRAFALPMNLGRVLCLSGPKRTAAEVMLHSFQSWVMKGNGASTFLSPFLHFSLSSPSLWKCKTQPLGSKEA